MSNNDELYAQKVMQGYHGKKALNAYDIQEKRIKELEESNKRYVEIIEGLNKDIVKLNTENKKLKDFCIWLTGCGYDFTQHDYFIKQRDELLRS